MDPQTFMDVANVVTKLKMYPYFDVANYILMCIMVREDNHPQSTGAQYWAKALVVTDSTTGDGANCTSSSLPHLQKDDANTLADEEEDVYEYDLDLALQASRVPVPQGSNETHQKTSFPGQAVDQENSGDMHIEVLLHQSKVRDAYYSANRRVVTDSTTRDEANSTIRPLPKLPTCDTGTMTDDEADTECCTDTTSSLGLGVYPSKVTVPQGSNETHQKTSSPGQAVDQENPTLVSKISEYTNDPVIQRQTSGPLPKLPTCDTSTITEDEGDTECCTDTSSSLGLGVYLSPVPVPQGSDETHHETPGQAVDQEHSGGVHIKAHPHQSEVRGNEEHYARIPCKYQTEKGYHYCPGQHNEGNEPDTTVSRAMHSVGKQVETVQPMSRSSANASHIDMRDPGYEGDIEKFLVTSLGGLLRSPRQQLSGSVPEGAVPPRDPVEITVMATLDPAFHPPHQAGEIPGPVYHFQPHGYLFQEDLVLQMSLQPLMPESAAQSSLTKTRVLYTATDVGEPARWETIYDNSKSDCRVESVVSANVTRTATVLRLRSLCGFCTLRQLVPTTTFNMRVYVQYEAGGTFMILTILFIGRNATKDDRSGAPDNLGQLVAIHPILVAQDEGSCITLDLRFHSGGWRPRRTSPRIESINAGFLLEGAQPYRQVAVTWQGAGEPEPLFEANVNMEHYDVNMSVYVIHSLPGLQKSNARRLPYQDDDPSCTSPHSSASATKASSGANGRGGSSNSDIGQVMVPTDMQPRPTPRPRSKPRTETDTSVTADDRYALPAPAKEVLTAWPPEAPTAMVSADIPNGGDTDKSRTDVNCVQYHLTNNFYCSSNKESPAGRLCPPVIPHRVKAKIASYLDTDRADGRDWQAFAEACGFRPAALKRRESPTKDVLEQLEAEPGYSLGKLLGILRSQDVGRDDVAQVVEEEMANR